MKLTFRKQNIPWLMATGRAALGPLVIAGQAAQWSGTTLAVMIVTALLSDIFDGVLARRWRCDTPAVRLFDSMADTFFYLCVATALWFEPSSVLRTHEPLLLTLGIMEAMRFLFDFGKFGKPASYHSYLAKTWGLLLATAVILSFVSTHATPWMIAALLLGIVCNTQDLIMSILLPTWQRDIKTPLVAWRLHREEVQRLAS